MYVKGKNIVIVGFGKSGFAAAELSRLKGANVKITEAKSQEDFVKSFSELDYTEYEIEWGGHSIDFIAGADIMVVSPGVKAESDCIKWAYEMGIKVISEIELASIFCKVPVIAVTGTNGKSTVTSLIGELVRIKGAKPVVCGNIGTPFSEVVYSLDNASIVVLEVSSFQLEFIDSFRPYISVFLNITDDHFDHHKDFNEYFMAKLRIFENQKESDWALLNRNYKQLVSYSDNIKANIRFFDSDETYNENEMAVFEVGRILDVDKDKMEDLFKAFDNLPYRMEHIGVLNEVVVINDSKSTNPGSTCWAVKTVDSKIVLIMCGRDKNNDFTVLRDIVSEKVKQLIVFGEAAKKIKEALEVCISVSEVETVEEAIIVALGYAEKGDTVLFSPGCASFDMFKDYADRGKIFTDTFQLVKAKVYA